MATNRSFFSFSFFKTPKHRVFHYEPIYYDETKERIEELKNEIEKEKALKEGRQWDGKYVPGRNIRGKMGKMKINSKKSEGKPALTRIITLVTLAILFVMLYYIAQYFGWFANIL